MIAFYIKSKRIDPEISLFGHSVELTILVWSRYVLAALSPRLYEGKYLFIVEFIGFILKPAFYIPPNCAILPALNLVSLRNEYTIILQCPTDSFSELGNSRSLAVNRNCNEFIRDVKQIERSFDLNSCQISGDYGALN